MKDKQNLMKLNPLAVSVLMALPVVASAADISISNGSISTANGVPVININQANGNGISHNIYDRLNVGREGVVFNNSQNGANSVLAGQIAGNSNLASGTANVILNEVTSRNASTLNGMMEVAGDKAQLIIANPNGITCNDCGFINSDKVTLTTGSPSMVNGELQGFSVSGGTITTNGLTSDSPTAILARSIVVNGEIRTTNNSNLTLIAGNNVIDNDNNITGTVRATGSRNTYAIDVARLGGMYANKINLVSTENGVGVRNLGVIAAGQEGLQITSNGRLLNSNAQMLSAGAIGIKTNGALENTTGQIAGIGDISIDTTKGAITNTRAGNISSASNVFVNSGRVDNTNGKIAATGMVAINTNNTELTNSGKGNTVGIEAGIVALETGTLNNRNGQIQGGYIGAQSTNVNNNGGMIQSASDIDISSTNNIDNTSGLIRSGNGQIRLAAANRITNRNTRTADTTGNDALGIISTKQGVQLSAATVDNSNGQVSTTGTVGIQATTVNNSSGQIQTESNVAIKAGTVNNSQSSITGKTGVDIELTGDLTNSLAFISAEEGTINVQARNIANTGGVMVAENISLNATNDVNNAPGLIAATEKLTVNAGNTVTNTNSDNFGSRYGAYLGMGQQPGGMIGNAGVEINARTLNNNSSRIVAENGTLNLTATGTFSNDRSLLVAGVGESTITANSLSSNYSTIYSAGDLAINAGSMSLYSSGSLIDNNATGIVAADGSLAINVAGNFTNYGWITGQESVTVNSTRALQNRGTIYSQNETTVSGTTSVTNNGDIVGDAKVTVTSNGTIANAGNMFSEGQADINGNRVQNTNRNAVLGGRQGLELHGNTVTGNGSVIGL